METKDTSLSKPAPETLRVSEIFFSIQGECATVGTPAVFLRLSGCQFLCKYCDTVDVWKRGFHYSFDELDALFERNGYYEHLQKGAHLVITGGDPLLQQDAIVAWAERLRSLGRTVDRYYVEVETQAAIQPNKGMLQWVRQWNVSPKLASSGMPEEKRIVEPVLSFYASMASLFKFPVANGDDVREVEALVRRFRIRRPRVYLMPVCSTKEEHEAMFPKMVEWCKKSGFKMGLRLQLLIWNKTTGV